MVMLAAAAMLSCTTIDALPKVDGGVVEDTMETTPVADIAVDTAPGGTLEIKVY